MQKFVHSFKLLIFFSMSCRKWRERERERERERILAGEKKGKLPVGGRVGGKKMKQQRKKICQGHQADPGI